MPALLAATALGLSVLVPAANADDEGYRMNDVGGTATLPAGYESLSWADWELKARSSRGVLLKLWLTPFQHVVDDAAVKAFAEVYTAQLEKEGVSDIKVVSTEINSRGDRRWGMVSFDLKIKGSSGVAHYAFAPSNGQMVHLRTVAGSRLRGNPAQADLDAVLSTLELDVEALPPETAVETAAGFAATLPEGWRVPFDKEREAVAEITGKLGEPDLPADQCWVGIRPSVGADPDVLFACKTSLQVGPLDEHSFAGVEAELHDKYFGRSDTPVEPGTPVEVGDRMGVMFAPPVSGQPVRLALAPYEASMMQVWGWAGVLDANGLHSAVTETLSSTTFTGPDGGAPIIGADTWVGHYLRYRPTSPLVLGPGLLVLGLVGGVVARGARRRDRFADLD